MKYYYVGTLLPALSFESAPEISFEEFDTLCRDNLTRLDYEKTKVIRTFYDILNLRALWKGVELDSWGNFDEGELQEALASHTELPDYVFEFINIHEKKEDRVKHFEELLAKSFLEVSQDIQDPFLKEYLQFERELRLVMVGFRAKKLGWNLEAALQFENPEEEIIAQMLAQKDAKEFIPPEKYAGLKVIFERYKDEPLELRKAIDQYRFDYVERMVDMADNDSIRRILAYMVQLIVVLRWFEMDKEKGKEIVGTIIKK